MPDSYRDGNIFSISSQDILFIIHFKKVDCSFTGTGFYRAKQHYSANPANATRGSPFQR